MPSVTPNRKGKGTFADMYQIAMILLKRERGERDELGGRMKWECRKFGETIDALNQKQKAKKEGWKEYKTKY